MDNKECCNQADVAHCSRTESCIHDHIVMIDAQASNENNGFQMLSRDNYKLQVRQDNAELENDKMQKKIIEMTKANDSLKRKHDHSILEVREPWPSSLGPLDTSTPAVLNPRIIEREHKNSSLPLVASTPAKNNDTSIMSVFKFKRSKRELKMLKILHPNTIKEPNKTKDEDVNLGVLFSELSLKKKKKAIKKERKVALTTSRVFEYVQNRFKVKRNSQKKKST